MSVQGIAMPALLRRKRFLVAKLPALLSAIMLRHRARQAARSGRVPAAINHYHAMARTGAAKPGWLVMWGHLLKGSGEIDRARAVYEAVAKTFPLHFDATRQLGFLLASSDDRQALTWLARAFVLHPDDREVRRHLFDAARSEAEFERAFMLAACRIARDAKRLEHPPGSLAERFRLRSARRAARRGRWEAAIDHYRRLVRVDTASGPLLVQFGHALREAGRLDEAETAYRRAIASAPFAADGHFYLGLVLRILDRPIAARHGYFMAWQLAPDLPHIADDLGATGLSAEEVEALRQGRWSMARTPAAATAVSQPDHQAAHAESAVSAAVAAHLDRAALQIWGVLIRLHPADPPPLDEYSSILYLTPSARLIWHRFLAGTAIHRYGNGIR